MVAGKLARAHEIQGRVEDREPALVAAELESSFSRDRERTFAPSTGAVPDKALDPGPEVFVDQMQILHHQTFQSINPFIY